MGGGLRHTGSETSKADEGRERSQAIKDAGVLRSVDERPWSLLTTAHGVARGELWEVAAPVGATLLRKTAVPECTAGSWTSRMKLGSSGMPPKTAQTFWAVSTIGLLVLK